MKNSTKLAKVLLVSLTLSLLCTAILVQLELPGLASGDNGNDANLSLQISNVIGSNVLLILHHPVYTQTGDVYEVWSKTDLTIPGWNIETDVWAVTNQNWTLFTVPKLNRTNLFIRSRDWMGMDENSNGIPDWWEYEHLGGLLPVITAQPASQTVVPGNDVTFSVVVSSYSTIPLTYQWYFNGTNLLAEAANTSLTLMNVQTTNAGNYSVVVTNVAGSVTSSNAVLTVNVPPVITGQPTNVAVYAGMPTQFCVSATGSALNYQWQFNGTNLSGATSGCLTLTNVQPSQAGNYSVVVSNSCGSVTSSNAVLTVLFPVITSFSPTSGVVGTVVNIEGYNFDPTPGNNIIYFGAVRAMVISASVTNLVVTVPVGATYAPITETVNGLTAYANQPFLPAFPGDGTGITTNSFAPRLDLPAGSDPRQVVIADLDGDGKPDLIVANQYDNTISIYQNIGVNGSLAFAARVDLTTPESPYGLAVADVDGDGKLDIIVSDYDNNTVSVYRNTCTPGNISASSFTEMDFATGAGPQGVAVADIDSDGKPDLVVANSGSGTVSILRNTSVIGSIAFAPHVAFVTGSGCDAVAVGDLDHDGNSDVVSVNSYNDWTCTMSVLQNISTPGNIAFAPTVNFPFFAASQDIVIGDMDGDGRLDVVVLGYGENFGGMAVYRNVITNPGIITTNSFATPVGFDTGGFGDTVAIGDLDGDGKPDMAATVEYQSYASGSGSNPLPPHLSVFENTSTPGSFTTSSFAARVDFPTEQSPYGVAIGDLDGDGRPDIVFCNLTNNTISIYQNEVPIEGPPFIITQPTDQAVTTGDTAIFTVQALGTQPLSYQWSFYGTNISGATNAMLTLTNVQYSQLGNYAVLVTNQFGSILSSNAQLGIIDPSTSLVQNGGFEMGDFTDWTTSGDLDYCDVTSDPQYVHSGVYGAQLAPPDSFGYLSKTLATTVGQKYLVSCWIWCDGQYFDEFSVSWNGTTLFDQQYIGTTSWRNLQFLVTAMTTSTLLTFGFIDDVRDPNYIGLDDIAVCPLLITINPPAITQQPANQTVSAGATAMFTVAATGNLLSYQWQYNGMPLTDGGNISGSTTANLVIGDVSAANVGTYTVVVTNFGGSITSSPATLTVVMPPYMVLGGGLTNYTFRGDMTYYIGGTVNLYGTNTFEGGTVIKYTNSSSAKLVLNAAAESSVWTFNTGPYRPVIFTSMNDNSVGATINGSSGNPATGQATYLCLSGDNGSPGYPVKNARFSFAGIAILQTNRTTCSPVVDGQFVNCQVAVQEAINSGGTPVQQLYNVLMANCSVAVSNTSATSLNIDGENMTVDQASTLLSAGMGMSGNFTNCILARVTQLADNTNNTTVLGDYNSFYNTSVFGIDQITNTSYPFQAMVAGKYYLVNGGANQNAGTTTIDPTLLADLQQKTTLALTTQMYTNYTIGTNVTLSPQTPRDTNSSPDLGYHYDPIDYVVDNYSIFSATMTVTNGAVIASYNEPGILLRDSSSIISIGSPQHPNWFVRYNSAQEQATSLGGTNPTAGLTVKTLTYGSVGPTGKFRFSKFACPAGGGALFNDASTNIYSSLRVQDCEFYSGTSCFNGNANTVMTLMNNLFARSAFTATNLATTSLILSNNLIFGTTVLLRNQATPNTWRAFNNAFDSCTITTNQTLGTLTNGYNAYLNCTGRFMPIGAFDVVTNGSLAYQTGPLGAFYQPTNSPLINQGNTNANLLGLYHYTVTTNEVVEGTNTVSIGYHYMATDANGNPVDSNGNGIPDYVEDANGDGVMDNGETPWSIAILTQPQSQAAIQGSNAIFSVTAEGIDPYYQWYFNGTNILGATNATLTLTNVQFSQVGNYSVVVSDPYSNLASGNATLTVVNHTNYYVATDGDDGNPGTLALPFQHIQKAASVMAMGNVCYIRGGTYRETIRPSHSGLANTPIVFCAYSNETVTISGCDVITNWLTYSNNSNIIIATNALPINQVFADGIQMQEARYPNLPIGSPMLLTEGWTNASVSCDANNSNIMYIKFDGVARPDNAWNGARIAFLSSLLHGYGEVVSSFSNNVATITNLSKTVDWNSSYSSAWPQPGEELDGIGFVIGSLAELDTPGEWYFDTNNSQLYLWPPTNAMVVEGRTRQLGFDLSTCTNIDMAGLNFMACSLTLSNAQYCCVDDCTVRYPRAYFKIGSIWNRNNWNGNTWSGTGIEMSGLGNTIKNSYVAHSWGDCISVWGTGNTVTNCVVEDADWSLTDCAPINITGNSNSITHCTVRLGDRGLIVHRGLANGLIAYNHIYNGGTMTYDYGLTYTFQDTTSETEIAYNWVHDHYNGVGVFIDNHYDGVGIYIDNDSANKKIHHNVIWRCGYGIKLNPCNMNDLVYNNTLWDISDFNIDGGGLTNVPVWNNLDVVTWNQVGECRWFSGTLVESNLTSQGTIFSNLDVGDFTPRPDSPTVDSGVVIGGLPTNFLGAAPDLGAYEYNTNNCYWVPGASFEAPVFPDTVPQVPGNVIATALTPYSICIKWTEAAGAQTYTVERSPALVWVGQSLDPDSPETWTVVATNIPAGTTSIEDYNLTPGTTNYYRVTSSSSVGHSIYSRPVFVVTPSDGSVLHYEAEQYDDMYGIQNTGSTIGHCDYCSWVKFSNVPLGNGYRIFRTRMGVPTDGGQTGQSVDIHLDGTNGPLVGSLIPTSTGSYNNFTEQTTNLATVTGTHDVYIVFHCTVSTNLYGVGQFDWFQFEQPNATNSSIMLEAESCNSNSGVSIVGDHIENCLNGNWVGFQSVNFSNGYNLFRTSLAVPDTNAGQAVDIRLDSPTGAVIGTLIPESTGSWTNWSEQWIHITGVGGTHDVYIVFRGTNSNSVGNFDWFRFENPLVVPPLRLWVVKYNDESGTVIGNTAIFAYYGWFVGNVSTEIRSCDDGDWVKFSNIDLGNRYRIFSAELSVPDSNAGHQVEVHLDSLTNNPVGTLTTTSTGSWTNYVEQTTTLNNLTNATGIHDIYIVFKGTNGVGNFKWFQLEEPDTGIPY